VYMVPVIDRSMRMRVLVRVLVRVRMLVRVLMLMRVLVRVPMAAVRVVGRVAVQGAAAGGLRGEVRRRGRLEPGLVDLDVHAVRRAAGVALPHSGLGAHACRFGAGLDWRAAWRLHDDRWLTPGVLDTRRPGKPLAERTACATRAGNLSSSRASKCMAL